MYKKIIALLLVASLVNLPNGQQTLIQGKNSTKDIIVTACTEENVGAQATKEEQSDITIQDEVAVNIDSVNNLDENTEWNMRTINADTDSTIQTNSKIKVAIIDSGIDYSDEIDVKERKNFVEGEDGFSIIYEDMTGHGTAVAGILAAKDNGIGITGINPNIELYSARVLDYTNTSPVSRIVDAVEWAIEKQVNIISISFGTSSESEELKNVIKKATDAGILVVAAAGNKGEVEFPAAYDNVLAVGSVDSTGKVSEESAKGDEIEVVAPGELVKSTGAFNGVIVSSGTSLAVPHVVGVASRLWEKDSSVSSDFIRKLIDYSANSYGDKQSYGYGLIDLEYANSVYDQFKESYSNVCDDKDKGLSESEERELLSSVEPNRNAVNVFNDVKFVEGSWKSADGTHPGFVTYGNSNNTSGKKLSATAIAIMKKGAVYQDYESSGLSHMTKNPLFHGYWQRTDSNDQYEYSSNYVAGYVYLTKLALAGGNESNIVFPTTANVKDSQSMVGKVSSSKGIKSGSTWVKWSDSKILGSYTNNATNRGYFLWGMAMHTITDIYAHSTYTCKNGVYTYINHDNGADEPGTKKARYDCAKGAAVNVVQRVLIGGQGDFYDFADNMNYDGTFYVRNLLRYCDKVFRGEDPTYEYYRDTIQSGDYTK